MSDQPQTPLSDPADRQSPETPAEDSSANAVGMTDQQLEEAKRYGRADVLCALADKAIDVAYLSVAALLLAVPLDGWLSSCPVLADYGSLRLVVLYLAVTAGHVAVSLPLSFYSGYVLEHRFGLSTLSKAGWLWRYVKQLGLTVAFGSLMFLGLFWLIWLAGGWWWLAAAGAFFCVSVVLGQLAPVLILPLFYKIEKLDDPEMADRMTRLTEGTGLSIEGVYRMSMSDETVKANAMLAGLGRTRRVILGDTLLDGFSADEIEVVFAHEIGHHVCRHIHKLILAGLIFSAAGFWICDRVLGAWLGRGGSPVDYAQMPVAALPLVMLCLTVFAMLLEPLQNALARRFERQADRYALDRTAQPAAYVSAFQKLARLNKDDPHPHPLDVLLFHSHPPIAERLAMAERWKKE